MNDDITRKIEFVVNQQAQFVVDMQQLQSALQQVKETQDADREMFRQQNTTLVAAMLRITEIVEAQQNEIKQLAGGLKELFDLQKHTDERLNALISIVERHVTDDGRHRKGETNV